MSDITYDTLGQVLLKALPELQEAFEAVRKWSDVGPHVVYEDVLAPYLREALRHPETHRDFLTRTLALLERLETHEDTKVENVGAVSIIEPLLRGGDPVIFEEAKRWMGPASLKTTIAMENWRRSR